ncbi:putative l-aminoadipate-semialdehyde dehydrogenase protein [Phaeoacremonium minimum UCRPA7]|uniref:Putative l-aminoadipate-semialdehyde dehydrogenase protein n=1 Tax=Phaeoacremonium minimum (strain UCR-PA7) TaxID=1286976 RepID=R8BGJ3_PHAM7|nr:putative l-aminoadipate-semialdehyde dehydrogenase protein [Phaeoacremonium minimum UCRPA7]EON98455.1 putative l-aminoadipate-semialdehyde dehydrogenase protein [Phaeoacremonium minimum UCRPA7]
MPGLYSDTDNSTPKINGYDERAQKEPGREWLSIPRTSEPADGWEKITYRQAAKAINRIAHRITAVAGAADPGEFPTIAYIGLNDSRYLAFMYGAVKAGYKALFVSPRNSVEGQLRLFQATDCHAVACSAEFETVVQSWVGHRPMTSFVLSPERELLADTADVIHIRYEKEFAEAQWDPFVVLHSSGSSGFPKPIVLKNGNMATADVPLFHIAGLYVATFYSTFYQAEQSLSLGIGTRPITADLMNQCLKHSGADAVFMPPSIVDDMALVPEYIETLKGLKYVAWGGENWRYFIFDKDYGGNDFRRLPGDEDIYKHFFKRQAKHPGLQGIFWTFPDIDEFDTQDLYRPHPTLEDHWLFYGRADSIIVFSNGEKLNPVTIEAVVLSHPQIKGTLVVGSNRREPALILEPVTPPKDAKEAKELIQSVWPLVQEANRDTVAHGHIQHDMIMLSVPDKPFPRAGKGTIQRPVAVQLYEKEISEVYDNAHREQEDVPVVDISSEPALRQSIEELLKSKLDVPMLDQDTDFFTMGMDSLQVIVICRLLTAGLKAAGVDVGGALAPRAIYSNPSLGRLSDYIFKLIESTGSHQEAMNGDATSEMKELVDKYIKGLPTKTISKPGPRVERQTVIITGSTGALGSYLLDLLISSDKIEKIICLNRAQDGGRTQQIQACAERRLTTDFTKCEFFHADLLRPDLGLGAADYDRISNAVDRIIHNAWPVNFNMPLSSFEPSIRGVRHLVDLSINAPQQVPIVFISSISTVDGWTDGNVPELSVQDLGVAAMGYGQSKHVSSLILDEAANVSGVSAASIRVGQIAGPRGQAGAWNKQEWFPSIIASSLHLGAIPTDLGRLSTVDWVPIEDVAQMVVEVSQQRNEDISGYFHCVNPAMTTWEELVPAVKSFYGSRITQLVTFKEWVELLKKSAGVTKDIQRNPGIKLLDSYEAQANAAGIKQVLLDMERTKRHVTGARELDAITPELVQNWCRQWDF